MGVEFAAPPANGRSTSIAAPHRMMPRPNFTGYVGCRSPRRVHRAPATPAKTMTNTGEIDCTTVGVTSWPNTDRLSRWSAYTARVVNCCW